MLKLKTKVMLKQCKVVMLPTNEKALIHFGTPKNNLRYTRLYKDSIHHKYQHLYIISDDEIKEGDWYVTTNKLFKADDKFDDGNNPNQHKNNKLVIATTDGSLKIKIFGLGEIAMCSLPQPSQAFIEKYVEEYNKGNQIVDVLVEYENRYIDNRPVSNGVVKVNPKDNTITIKKVKDSWNREEVEIIYRQGRNEAYKETKAGSDLIDIVNDSDKWIKENL